jgi:hypothetical protein
VCIYRVCWGRVHVWPYTLYPGIETLWRTSWLLRWHRRTGLPSPSSCRWVQKHFVVVHCVKNVHLHVDCVGWCCGATGYGFCVSEESWRGQKMVAIVKSGQSAFLIWRRQIVCWILLINWGVFVFINALCCNHVWLIFDKSWNISSAALKRFLSACGALLAHYCSHHWWLAMTALGISLVWLLLQQEGIGPLFCSVEVKFCSWQFRDKVWCTVGRVKSGCLMLAVTKYVHHEM